MTFDTALAAIWMAVGIVMAVTACAVGLLWSADALERWLDDRPRAANSPAGADGHDRPTVLSS